MGVGLGFRLAGRRQGGKTVDNGRGRTFSSRIEAPTSRSQSQLLFEYRTPGDDIVDGARGVDLEAQWSF